MRHAGAPSKVRLSAVCGGGAPSARARSASVGADVEVRPLPIVAHEERAAVFQPAIQMHDGYPQAPGVRDDAVVRLEEEAAHLHAARAGLRRGDFKDGESSRSR